MKNFKTVFLLLTSVLFFLIVSPGTFAGNSWFSKGSELFKSFGLGDTASDLTMEEISAGLKEALKVGSENVVNQLGAMDGFNKDSNIHIPLPASLNKAKTMLDKVGMSYLLDDLELKLNRAAESATPKAKQLFYDSITQMTFVDVKNIYNGQDDAATQYFKEKMSPGLMEEMKPVVDQSLSQVGAIKSYDNMITEYKRLPFVPDIKSDLSNHVIENGIDGIFYYIAKEEAAIRKDPVKRTTDLLKKVFGNKK